MLRRRPPAPAEEDRAAGEALDAAALAVLGGLRSLSDLTSPLALTYLERIGRPIQALSPEAGARITSTGYAAHLAVESDAPAFGVTAIPVLGTLPERPPADLLLRVVKATRRSFETIRAVDGPTWEALVTIVAARAGADLERGLVDGLLRFGWVLRQVDLAYGAQPERATPA